MKHFMFSLFLAVMASTGFAQLEARDVIHEYINTEYQEKYTVVSIDTVAMPIRILMSFDYAMTLEGSKAIERLNDALEINDPTLQAVAVKKLANDMEESLKTYITPNEIVTMRYSNTPHEDDYYNYQRTVVYLEESRRKETFYIRMGEESISMTRTEYDTLEADAFLKYWNYSNLLKKLKELSRMY